MKTVHAARHEHERTKKMKLITVKRIFAFFCVNHLLVGTRCFEAKRRLLNFAGYEVGENTRVVGPVRCTGNLRIGKNCWIGRSFTVHGNGTVEIGDNCDVAPEVSFFTGGHQIGTPERRAGLGQHYTIDVGNGTWIGARSTITNNITIGESCVLAACACVVKDIPENTLVGGVPARIIRVLQNEIEQTP